MPTENRSSNTELQQIEAAGAAMTQIRTMLGREQRPDQVAAALEACDWSGTPIGNKAIILSAIRALRAPQHQGEPVALPERKEVVEEWATPGGPYRAEGWNACRDEIAKLGPLYPRPVQGEPVAWTWQGALDELKEYCPDGVRVFPHKAPGRPIPLYTHADPGEVERLRAALKFYADREHYHFESGKWDTVSGEPLNILWCGDEPDFIEDGTVARAALERQP